MKITIYSVVSSIMLSSLFFAAICIIRRKIRFSHMSEVISFAFLYVLGFIRLILPLDFEFTKGIPISGIFTWFWKLLYEKRYYIFGIGCSIGNALGIIIGCISIVRLIYFGKECTREEKYWRNCENYSPEQTIRVCERLRSISFTIPRCILIKDAAIEMPFVTGIFNPKVVLPDTEYSDSELYYVLMHEFTHLHRKDLYKKLCIEVFNCIFWWIPFGTFVSKDFDQITEIRCDRRVINALPKVEQLSYMKVLIDSMRRGSGIKSTVHTLPFALYENQKTMIERFKLMSVDDDGACRNVKKWAMILGIVMFVSSYLVVPFPNFQPNDSILKGREYSVDSDNTYLVLEEGQYYLLNEEGIKIGISVEQIEKMILSGINLEEKK